MELEYKYATAEEIPSGYAELYTEKDGAFVFTGVKGVVSAEGHANVERALTNERQAHRAAKATLETVRDAIKKAKGDGDGSVDDLEDIALELEELRTKGDGKDPEKFEEAVAQRVARELRPVERERDRYKTESEENKGRADALQSDLDKGMIREAIRAAATDAGCDGDHIDDIVDLRLRSYEVLREDGAEPRVVTRDGVGLTPGVDPAEDLSQVKTAGTKSHWWPATKGDKLRDKKPGGGGANPWAENTFNLTEQARLMRENPSMAERLKQAAGAA